MHHTHAFYWFIPFWQEKPYIGFREHAHVYMEKPPLRLQSESQDGGELVRHDMGLQLLFGFSLFLVMFTVGFKVNTITKDKASGVWNRLILSPVRKTEMYMGHLLYSSLIGVLQIIMVLIFRYGFGFSYGTSSCVKEDRRQEECRFVEIGKSPYLRNKIAEVAH